MDSGKQRIYRILGFIFHYIVAVVFLLAAFSKALDMPAFYEQIAAYGIFPELAPLAAWTFVIAECIIAGMLITHAYSQLAQLGAGLLLVLFVGVTGYGMATGQLSECGCFGNVLPRTPQQTLIEDILMIAALVFAFTVFRKDKPKKQGVRMSIASVFGVLGLALALASPQLPVDDMATQLKPGAQFDAWPVEGIYQDLNEGSHLVILFSIQSEEIDEQVAAMNELAQDQRLPSSVGLIIDGTEQLTTLMFQYGTAFPVGAVEPRFARNLYRELPRAFILSEGVVTATWSHIPSADEVLAAMENGK